MRRVLERLFGLVVVGASFGLLLVDGGLAATANAASPKAALESALPEVSPAAVEADLEIQRQGNRVDIVEQLSESLGDEYAGVWFDNEAGQFVVPLAPAHSGVATIKAAAGKVGEEFRSAALRGGYRTEVVASSREELLTAQAGLNEQLAPYFESASVQTALNPETNAIEVRVPEGMDSAALGAVERIADGSKVEVEVIAVPPSALKVGPTACNEAERKCQLPVRGGEVMYGGPAWSGPNGETLTEVCSVGFRANGNEGKKYLLTAGHCAKRNAEPGAETNWTWMTQYGGTNYNIGTTTQFHYPGKDWAKIDATGTDADVTPWPTELAYWGANQEYPIYAEATSYKGQTLCHVGANTGVSCGIVHAENVTVEYTGGVKLNSMFEVTGAGLALGGGDSGGPVVASNVALGLVSGGISAYNNATVYFSGITAADAELNVNVAGPGAPEAITGASENVTSTQATISGQVNPRGLQCNYTIEYGQGAYNNSTSAVSAGSGQGFVNVGTTLTGLQPLGRYQYRIKATNAYGTAFGHEGTFTTSSAKQIAVARTKTSWSGVMWSASDGNVYETDAPAGEWESYAPTWERRGIPSGVRPVSGPTLTPGPSGWGGGIAWTGSDGNIYVTQAPAGAWESWSPTWSHSGIPSGVSVVSQPTVIPSGSTWAGFLWVGSDGNIYWTRAEASGAWTSFSPTWSRRGLPAGVKPVGNLVVIPSGGGLGGILWTGSDGNLYDTQAPNGEWESWSPTWSRKGIPGGVRAVSTPALWTAANGGWLGAMWIGSDGNVYETHATAGEWSSFSPTWNRTGLPSGVKPLGDPVTLPSSNGSAGVAWVATDGNIYVTQPTSGGGWESWSPTWSHNGIPAGVRPVADAAVIPAGEGWEGLIWPGSDGNLYDTRATGGAWASFSPTWSRRGIPAGVTFAR